MNEEQGFTSEPKSELVELNYVPMFRHFKCVPKTYAHPLKLAPPCITPPVPFVNQPLKQHLAEKFMSKHQGRLVYQYQSSQPLAASCVTFDSQFEGGNLEYVLESSECRFELFMRPDTNTSTHFQWFNFTVKSKATRKIALTIKNFIKPQSLYRRGLKPYVKSLKKGEKGYQQIAGEVAYERSEEETRPQLYELHFEYTFEFNNDQVSFCSQPAYSFARVEKLIKGLPFQRMEITKTMLGNKISAVLVNEHSNYRAVVVALARQHPGQAVGSWLMEGFINRLKTLSDSSIFWIIIPMVNADGVILGNNRTGLLGYDFNRNWYHQEQSLRQHLFPELIGICKYFKSQKRRFAKKVKLFIDFHGHSSQPNVFCYGPPHHQNSQYFQNSRLFPYMISKRNADFNLTQCSFEIESQKKNCSRAVFFSKFGFPYSYTIESSFGIYRDRRITEIDVTRMGEDVCQVAVDFITLLLQKPERQELELLGASMRAEMFSVKTNEYDSDSEEEDEAMLPLRLEFEKRVTDLFVTAKAEQDRGDANHRKRKESMNDASHKTDRYVTQNYSKMRNQRMKTEQLPRLDKYPKIVHNGSIYLPRLSPSRRMRTRQSPLNSAVRNCNLDSLTLQQLKERLMFLKHSKLGKRILILNCHQNAAL